jgi:hypothetical protein
MDMSTERELPFAARAASAVLSFDFAEWFV